MNPRRIAFLIEVGSMVTALVNDLMGNKAEAAISLLIAIYAHLWRREEEGA